VCSGNADGKVIAYDAKNGKRLWATVIGGCIQGRIGAGGPIVGNGMVVNRQRRRR